MARKYRKLKTEKNEFEKSDNLGYYYSGDLYGHIQTWIKEYEDLTTYEKRRTFLEETAWLYKWGVACRYYSENIDIWEYFFSADQEELSLKIDWYIYHNAYLMNDQKWREFRHSIALEYDDSTLKNAEELDMSYERA